MLLFFRPSWETPLIRKMAWLLEESPLQVSQDRRNRRPREGPQLVQNWTHLADQAFSCTAALAAMPWLLLPLFPEAKENANIFQKI